MGNRLKNRVAIVTGAGRGIGRAIALAMANEGAKIVVNDLGTLVDGTGASTEPADEAVQEIRRHGGVAVANYDSVATMQGGEKIVKAAIDNFGRIDILVNNAGIIRLRSILDMSEDDWDAIMEANLKGTFVCTKFAVRYMVAQKYGRIINMSSVGALGYPFNTCYSAAKAGILGFTRSCAIELGKTGITANAIFSSAHTRMLTAGQESPLDWVRERQRRGHRQKPEEVPPIVLFLATDQAANINGCTFATRLPGVIQLYSEQAPVKHIYKQGSWTLEELLDIVPKTLAVDLVSPATVEPPTG